MTEEEIEKMSVSDWEKFFVSSETQPGTIDLNNDVTDHENDDTETGTVNLFKD
ncbi:MAG: hypothetical protein JG761_134 [Proteiniphilum sp.]|nr:hypothetical protein [Proteiniphilum sp.]